MFPGTAALINLHGYTPDQMYANFKGVVVNFHLPEKGGFDRRTDEDIKSATEKAMKKLNEVFDRATQYHKLDSATKAKGVGYYPEMEAMMGAVRGERCNHGGGEIFAKDILEALKWIKNANGRMLCSPAVAKAGALHQPCQNWFPGNPGQCCTPRAVTTIIR